MLYFYSFTVSQAATLELWKKSLQLYRIEIVIAILAMRYTVGELDMRDVFRIHKLKLGISGSWTAGTQPGLICSVGLCWLL